MARAAMAIRPLPTSEEESVPTTRRTDWPSAAALAALLVLAGCATVVDPGPQRSEVREVADVTAADLRAIGNLTVTAGETTRLTVTAGEDVLDRLTSEVDDGTLVLDAEGVFGSLGEVRYDLVVPRLDAVIISGSGNATVTDVPATVALELAVDGSGDITAGGLDVDDLRVRIGGSGDVEVEGRADAQQVGIGGSGAYRADGLESSTAQVSIEGSGGVEVRVSDQLDVSISGSGDVVYSGDPAVTSSVTGSGAVRAH
jgi:uncharacterized protein YjeT (DUF2065 family)